MPYEIDLQQSAGFVDWAQSIGADPVSTSAVVVKLGYAGLFLAVLLVLIWMSKWPCARHGAG